MITKRRMRGPAIRGAHKGFTLVELMIALVLGLILIGGVISVFLANKQSYRTNEALSQVQDQTRVAYEYLARDIRQAGSNICGSVNIASVLNSSSGWWYDWSRPIVGYEDASSLDGMPASGSGQPVPDSDAILLGLTRDLGLRLDEHQPAPTAANLQLSETTNLIGKGDILMVCDVDKATIFQVTSTVSSQIVTHGSGGGNLSPGNCTKGLNHSATQVIDCSTISTNGYGTTLSPASYIVFPQNVIWYVGYNPDGGTSLYRISGNQDGSGVGVPEEMVRGITSLEVGYLEGPSATTYRDADDATSPAVDWSQVTAVRMTLQAESAMQRAGTDQAPLRRNFSAVTTIRARAD